jgi:membrane protein
VLAEYVYGILNHIVSLVVVTAWFFILFRFLPDGRPHWTLAFTGAFVTGALFTIGKYFLHWVLTNEIQELYGGSGAMVLILLFVFYSSLILYFGAAFTRAWAIHCDSHIEPLPHASLYHISKGDDQTSLAAET